jgi:hypothetical protein
LLPLVTVRVGRRPRNRWTAGFSRRPAGPAGQPGGKRAGRAAGGAARSTRLLEIVLDITFGADECVAFLGNFGNSAVTAGPSRISCCEIVSPLRAVPTAQRMASRSRVIVDITLQPHELVAELRRARSAVTSHPSRIGRGDVFPPAEAVPTAQERRSRGSASPGIEDDAFFPDETVAALSRTPIRAADLLVLGVVVVVRLSFLLGLYRLHSGIPVATKAGLTLGRPCSIVDARRAPLSAEP